MRSSSSKFLLTLIAAVLLLAPPVWAQGTTSTIMGIVTHDGEPLPGVTVTIASPALQGTRTEVTGSGGGYNFGAVPPGLYTVTFEMAGMQTVVKTQRVGLAQTARVNADMMLTAVAQAITVTASAPAVLETVEVESNIEADLVEDLPMGRTLAATTLLAPGTTNNGPNNGITMSGAFSYDNLFLVNGAVVNENLRGQPHNLFIEEAIQETTVMTGAISAEYGRFTGGVVTAITKSGGNEFSGSVRDSLTNPRWTEQTPLNEPEGPDELNEVYEATLGGYVLRDRLWFFTAGRFFETEQQRFLTQVDPTEPQVDFIAGDEETRFEGKLTGRITDRHTLIGSYMDVQRDQTNNCFIGCYEVSNVDPSRSLPNDFFTINYNGILSDSFLVEALYAQKNFAFEQSGGNDRSLVGGTWGRDLNTGAFFGAPVFCGVCPPEERNNENWTIKGTYFWTTPRFGVHNLVAGYEDWSSVMISNNFQSGSDFSLFVFNSPQRANDGTLLPVIREGDFIAWWPIFEETQGSDWSTRSVFINDKWDLNENLSFNIGARWDNNEGRDSAGNLQADDSKISPRLGVNYDLFGDGRLRLNASFSRYVSKVAEANVGDAASAAGSPSFFLWEYAGPDITGLPTEQAFAQVFSWFESVGGVDNRTFLLDAETAGIATRIPGSLESPHADEWSVGLGTRIGARGYLRADYINREWGDFYANELTLDNPTAVDPVTGVVVDVTFVVNSDAFTREYEAIQMQGSYRLLDRLNIGGSATWSELVGNIIGETAGSGPVPVGGPDFQPEFFNFPQNNPVGPLPQDQEWKVRAWISYDQPTPIGNFNFSVLQSYDTGTPFSAVGSIPVRGVIPNPGYQFTPTTADYFFSERGAFRWDDVTSTDFALNYALPLFGAELFIQAEVLNVFDEDAQIAGNTTVLTARNRRSLEAFDPFTETPVEGVHYVFGPSFGQATLPGHFQLPRTYRGSVGFRF